MKTKVVKRYLIGGLMVGIANLLVLDYFFVKTYVQEWYVLGTATTSAAAAKCPSGCLAAINKLSGTTSAASVAKEYYVPLGAGSVTATDWADVQGASEYVNTAQYPNIKQVVFDATISVSTGTVWVRLFNKTDGHPVWYSDMSANSATPNIVSHQMTLDPGNKLYQVQMKTQLAYPATLSSARIHITTY